MKHIGPNPPEEQQSQANEEISQLSKHGYQLLKVNLIHEAEKIFLQIIEQEPHNNYALVGLGDISRKKRDYLKAVSYYQECLVFHPENNYAHFGLADCFKEMKRLPEAITAWEYYLETDPTNITVITRIADACRKLKNFNSSKKYYERALDINQTNPYALIGIGHLYFDFEIYESALYYWEKLYHQNPDSVDIRVLTSIGNCHRKLKTYNEGLEYFTIALNKDKNNFFALFGAADCHRGMNEYDQSLTYWLRILENDPKNKVILTRAADAYRTLGDIDTARDLYQKALSISFDYYAIFGLVAIHKINGEFSEALSKLHDMMSRDSKNHRLYIEAAKCYLEQGYKSKAVAILKEFQSQGIHNIYVNNLLNEIND